MPSQKTLTTDLSYLPGAMIIARHSAATFENTSPVDVSDWPRLGVRYVVEGSVSASSATCCA